MLYGGGGCTADAVTLLSNSYFAVLVAFTFYSLLIFCVFGNFSCTCGIIQNLYSLGIVIEGIKYDEGLADGGAEHVKSEYAPTLVPTGKHAL